MNFSRTVLLEYTDQENDQQPAPRMPPRMPQIFFTNFLSQIQTQQQQQPIQESIHQEEIPPSQSNPRIVEITDDSDEDGNSDKEEKGGNAFFPKKEEDAPKKQNPVFKPVETRPFPLKDGRFQPLATSKDFQPSSVPKDGCFQSSATSKDFQPSSIPKDGCFQPLKDPLPPQHETSQPDRLNTKKDKQNQETGLNAHPLSQETQQRLKDIQREMQQTGRTSPTAGFFSSETKSGNVPSNANAYNFHSAAARANLVSPTQRSSAQSSSMQLVSKQPSKEKEELGTQDELEKKNNLQTPTKPVSTSLNSAQPQLQKKVHAKKKSSAIPDDALHDLKCLLQPGRQADEIYFSMEEPDMHPSLCTRLALLSPSAVLAVLVSCFAKQCWITWWLETMYAQSAKSQKQSKHPLVVVMAAYSSSYTYQNCLTREEKQRRSLTQLQLEWLEGIEPPEALTLDDLEILILSYMGLITQHDAYQKMKTSQQLFAIADVEASPTLAQTYIEQFLKDCFFSSIPPSDWPSPSEIGRKYLSGYCNKTKMDLLTTCALKHNRAVTIFLLDTYQIPPQGSVWNTTPSSSSLASSSSDKTSETTSTSLMVWFDYFCELQTRIVMPDNILCGIPTEYMDAKTRQNDVLAILFKMFFSIDNADDGDDGNSNEKDTIPSDVNPSNKSSSYPYETYMTQKNANCAKFILELFSFYVSQTASESYSYEEQDKNSLSQTHLLLGTSESLASSTSASDTASESSLNELF